jgi:hypothetical protein
VVVALAAAVPRAISLSPSCGPVGSTVQVSGSGWTAGFDVTITFDPQGTPPYSVVVPGKSIGANGTFTASLTVPSRPDRGLPYQVTAQQTPPAGLVLPPATASFSIPCPSLTLNPSCGGVGDRILVHGAGFHTDLRVLVSLEPPAPAKPDATAVPRVDGTFDVVIPVSSRPPGSYFVVAVQPNTPYAARAQFPIPCPRASIVLRPKVGPPGTVVTVTGIGFPVGALVRLSWSQGIPISGPSITIGAGGGFQMTLLIFPHDELGKRRLSAGPDLSAAGAPLFNIATADFLAVPGMAQPRDFSWRR